MRLLLLLLITCLHVFCVDLHGRSLPRSTLRWNESQWQRAYPVTDGMSTVSAGDYLFPNDVHHPNVTDRGRARSDESETYPKTVTFDHNIRTNDQQTTSTPNSPVVHAASNQASTATAGPSSPYRQLPSLPHSNSHDSSQSQSIYSQLALRSADISGTDEVQDNDGNCRIVGLRL